MFYFVSGNQCRIILQNIDKLNIPQEYVEFQDALESLYQLNHMVSQEVLPNNYTAVINRFSNKWFILSDKFSLSTPPKLHIVIDHLQEYFDATGLSLVKTSDQLIENMHQFVHKMMSRSNYYIKHVENPHHGALLFRAVQHLNCMNISLRNKQYLNLYYIVLFYPNTSFHTC